MKRTRSEELFRKAQEILPGGVNSPVRAFRSVGGTPVFISRAKGSRIWDEDAHEYIDYVGSWGPMILGHADDRIEAAVLEAARKGTSFGAATALEIEMAECIRSMIPSIEMVRMVNSGTEATMSALRLARAFTGKPKIIKFEGCYHGHADSFLIKAGSGAMTLGVPDSPGVPDSIAQHTLTATFNDLSSVERLVTNGQDAIAAVIVEPIVGNMGCVPPSRGFLEGLRELCTQHSILLIFDEVMTGFRVAPGGAQELYGIRPDLTTLGKIIGGGLPVGAYGGRKEIMQMVAPSGPVYQAGTLSGNPLAMAAGLEMLRILKNDRSIYDQLEQKGLHLSKGLQSIIDKHSYPATQNRVGSMTTVFFTSDPVTDYHSAQSSDTKAFARYFTAMLNRGIYLAPSQFEAAFISLSHTEGDLQKTIDAAEESLAVAFSKPRS